MELTNLDFQQARIKQVLFKSRLRSVLYGVREPDDSLFSIRENPLGQWLYAVIQPQYGTTSHFLRLERELHQMLLTGQGLVRQYQRGQLEEARAGLEHLDAHAARIETLLLELEQAV